MRRMIEIFMMAFSVLLLLLFGITNLWCLMVMGFLIFDALVLYPMEQREFGPDAEKMALKRQALEICAAQYGIKRKKYLGMITESDSSLKRRMMNSVRGSRV